jgi:hypothetical protein
MTVKNADRRVIEWSSKRRSRSLRSVMSSMMRTKYKGAPAASHERNGAVYADGGTVLTQACALIHRTALPASIASENF